MSTSEKQTTGQKESNLTNENTQNKYIKINVCQFTTN